MKHFLLPYFPQTLEAFVKKYAAKYGDNEQNLKDGIGYNWNDDALYNATSAREMVPFGPVHPSQSLNKHGEVNGQVILKKQGTNPLGPVENWDMLMILGHGVVYSDPHDGSNRAAAKLGSDPIARLATETGYGSDGTKRIESEGYYADKRNKSYYATVNDVGDWLAGKLKSDHVLLKMAMCLGGGKYGERVSDDNFAKRLAVYMASKGYNYLVVGGYRGTLTTGIGGMSTSETVTDPVKVLTALIKLGQQHFKSKPTKGTAAGGEVYRYNSPVPLSLILKDGRISKVVAGPRSEAELKRQGYLKITEGESFYNGGLKGFYTPPLYGSRGAIVAPASSPNAESEIKFAAQVKFTDFATLPSHGTVSNPANDADPSLPGKENLDYFHGATGEYINPLTVKVLKLILNQYSGIMQLPTVAEKKERLIALVEKMKNPAWKNGMQDGGFNLALKVVKMLVTKSGVLQTQTTKTEEAPVKTPPKKETPEEKVTKTKTTTPTKPTVQKQVQQPVQTKPNTGVQNPSAVNGPVKLCQNCGVRHAFSVRGWSCPSCKTGRLIKV